MREMTYLRLFSLMSALTQRPGIKEDVTRALFSGSRGDRWAESREVTSPEENLAVEM